METGRWSRIEDLFHQAADLNPADRAAFLETACGGDADLWRELQSLLASEQQSTLLGGAIQAAIGQAAEHLAAGSDDGSELIGQRIGRYTLTGLIGKGGMGAVYRAMRDDDFQMEVAIKVIKRGTDTDEALRRFRTERQILAGLRHPNIAGLLDGGATESGLPYFVMEYVEGKPLLEYAAPLTVRQRVELFRGVCCAVQYAHRKMIVHRDIKPPNILVTQEGIPKLLDFGIAKLLDPATDGAATAMTVPGARLMTPDYASPEQIRGEPITTATDIYSLGAVLYELLTRQPAYHFETHSPSEVEKEICSRDPAKPSAVATDVDPELDTIVLKALEKDPRDRYTSVEQLAEDLYRFLHGELVQVRKGAVRRRLRKQLVQRRAVIATAALVIIGVIVGAGIVFGLGRLRSRSENESYRIAVLPLENLSHDAEQEYFADGMTDALINTLGRSSSFRVISRTSVMSYKGVRRPLPEIARSLGVQKIAEGSVFRAGNRVRISVRLVDAPKDHPIWTNSYEGDLTEILALQDRVAAAVASQLGATVSGASDARGSDARINVDVYDAYLKGRYALFRASVADLQRAIQLFQYALGLDPRYAPAYAGLADCYMNLSGMYLTPREAMSKARAAAARALEIDPNLAEAHTSLGLVEGWYDFDWTKAENELKHATDLSPNEAASRLWYGHILITNGKPSDGIRQVQLAHELDPLSAFVETGLGQAYFLTGHYMDALRQLRSVVESDPNFVHGHLFLGVAYLYTHEYREAAGELEKAIQMEREPESIAYDAYANAKLGDQEAAIRTLKQLVGVGKTQYVSGYLFAIVSTALGGAIAGKDAIGWLEQAYEDRDDMLGWVGIDPIFDGLRGDPRFDRLVQRLGLRSSRLPTTSRSR